MTTFRVWAPEVGRVEVEVDGAQRHAMQRGEGGWWTAQVETTRPEAPPELDYAFVLDGGEPRPDPRSPWQPHGVHGPSRVVDHGTFAWSDEGWQAPPLSSALIYEVHVGTFTADGTFEAAIERLDHLVELGVTHVELLPVCSFSGSRGWGYDGVQPFAPHEAYGGPQGLKRLVDACHQRGMAVLLDVVYNHLGPEGNYLGQFGPYFTDVYHTPWGEAVNFDGPHSDEVRRYFCDNACMWLRDYHFDGLRLDAVHAIHDRSAYPFLEQLTDEVAALSAQLGRHLVLIAESDLNDPRVVRPREAHGFGHDAQWSDDFHHALHALLTGERDGYYADFGSLEQLATALRQAFVYDGCYSRYRKRRHGRSARGLSGHRFLGYLQNHDQIGNRARGERTSHLLEPERLEVAAALVLCAPFVPMLFQGEEWGASAPFQYFTDHGDAALAEAVSQGRRSEFAAFGWAPQDVPDPQALSTFERSKLDWDEREREPHARLLRWHRALIGLRRRFASLSDGHLERVEVAFDETARWLRMQRGRVTLCCNLGADAQRVPLLAAQREHELVLASQPEATRLVRGGVELPPDAVAITTGD